MMVEAAGNKDSPMAGADSPMAGASSMSAFWNIAKMSVGIGMLGMPSAFKAAGYVPATLAMVGVGFLSVSAVLSFSRSCKITKEATGAAKVSYIDNVAFHLGKVGKHGCAACVMLSLLGCNISYNIFLSGTITQLVPSISLEVCIIALQVPFALLSLIRSTRWLALPSFLGMVCLWTGCAAALCIMFQGSGGDSSLDLSSIKAVSAPHGFMICFGIVGLGLEGLAAAAPTIEAGMAYPKHFPRVACLAVCLIIAINILFGFIGYLAYGDAVNAIITKNFPPCLLASIASILLSGELMFTFPGNMYPVSKFFDAAFFPPAVAAGAGVVWDPELSLLEPEDTPSASMLMTVMPDMPDTPDVTQNRAEQRSRVLKSSLLRLLVTLLQGVVGYVLRDVFAEFMAIVGCLAGTTLLFLLPGLIELKIGTWKSRAGVLAICEVVVGVAAVITGIALAAGV
eukprot:TRINITY_DN25887_c0_g1_i1.p1 TRINITY_DN25887_c0_g1~~TRINITY_DN25887_c0_g1_i1.p1  ORF type:complete len:454 (-),score=53.07 TRINITY_DN25887_c0_g1_i1:132-1493(-)